MLTRDAAVKVLQQSHSSSQSESVGPNITEYFINHHLIKRHNNFELFMRWMCQRSTYIVFAESAIPQNTLAEDFLQNTFGWVECVAASDVRYGTSGSHTTCYFLLCHPGQYDTLASFMSGLHDYGDDCPVEDLAFIEADGLPRLATVSHEELAWLTIPQTEPEEARESGQSWLSVQCD